MAGDARDCAASEKWVAVPAGAADLPGAQEPAGGPCSSGSSCSCCAPSAAAPPHAPSAVGTAAYAAAGLLALALGVIGDAQGQRGADLPPPAHPPGTTQPGPWGYTYYYYAPARAMDAACERTGQSEHLNAAVGLACASVAVLWAAAIAGTSVTCGRNCGACGCGRCCACGPTCKVASSLGWGWACVALSTCLWVAHLAVVGVLVDWCRMCANLELDTYYSIMFQYCAAEFQYPFGLGIAAAIVAFISCLLFIPATRLAPLAHAEKAGQRRLRGAPLHHGLVVTVTGPAGSVGVPTPYDYTGGTLLMSEQQSVAYVATYLAPQPQPQPQPLSGLTVRIR